MAQGRDFQRLSPRWLNCTLCASGLTAAGLFIWRVLFVEAEQGFGLLPRLLGAAVLPVLLCVTALGRAARRVREL